ncbi:MAG TPA: IS701 family transposase [Acidimicrobiales bacterium]|nr:IS701 family transposase [Acidimicrobiales bacterium]
MCYDMDPAAQQRMESYFTDGIGPLLRNKNQRASFSLYAQGILGQGERKSAEPIAARLTADPAKVNPMHQRLLHFLANAVWDDQAVRLHAARYALEPMQKRGPVLSWSVDDTGFLKQGTHSVGVQRQYTGSAGKVTNCQVAVSLTLCTAQAHLPVDMALYLPQQWAQDPVRRQEAHIPPQVEFQTKPQLAVQMLRRAVDAGLPKGAVLADSAYGNNGWFREQVLEMGLPYGVGLLSTTLVQVLDAQGQRCEALSASELARRIGRKGFRRHTWREGTRRRLESRFAFVPVAIPGQERKQLLVIEWPLGEAEPEHYFLCTFGAGMTHKAIVRLLKERYRIEQTYREMKGELGLDHFEGRSYRGWNHHVSVVLSCYALVLAERERAFPPSARSKGEANAQHRAA